MHQNFTSQIFIDQYFTAIAIVLEIQQKTYNTMLGNISYIHTYVYIYVRT